MRLLPLLVATLVGLLFALASGSVDLTIPELIATLSGSGEPLHQTILYELRLPRAVAAATTGALLALAGVLMQVLLRNPLADPYILGISGGAAVAALLSILLGLGGAWLTGSALLGALLAMALVFGLARGKGDWSPSRLLLTGVVIAAGWGALISFILTLSPADHLHGMLFWLMGDLSNSSSPWGALIILIIGLLLTLPLARNLNILAHGELQATTLGIDVTRLRFSVYLLASLLTAAAVVQAGTVGFVGLIVPHLLRLSGFRDHRLLIPASALLGATLLLFADTLARVLLAPQQLPVGVVTAMLGVPLFLYLLRRSSAHGVGQ
ncbi:ABC transporter permease [Solemya pervernicosa gill symbiont]|uniref:ABC transporter permease n=2 Tax=Gammaproteobacteria incertae sedis TaxID=118884 RepID=A0A1T2L0G2_9GAMM|nr:iron ABC transporter permease [Candidatus Reidiella endopervernicosa]OOZ38562.1 ABC transporter permease [Solemya pervernicosa gill symbiont]QKQ28315.1 iron ABC transporter permease [Candidatus Reidiella endopervernicosa]